MLFMEPVALLALTVLLLLAMWKDFVLRRIPNMLVLWGLITALVLSLTPRGIGWESALAGGLTGFLVFFLLYLFRMVGAGDVKLVATVGLYIGWPEMGKVCISILLAGGVVSAAWALWTSSFTTVIKNIHTGLSHHLRVGQWPQVGQSLMNQVSHERVPYALAVGMGTAAHLAMVWHSK